MLERAIALHPARKAVRVRRPQEIPDHATAPSGAQGEFERLNSGKCSVRPPRARSAVVVSLAVFSVILAFVVLIALRDGSQSKDLGSGSLPLAPGPAMLQQVRQELPDEYQGTWYGALTVSTGQGVETVRVIFHIGPGYAGDVVGTFQQPGCSGRVIYDSGWGPVRFIDQLTNGGPCVPTILARAVLVGPKHLSLMLYDGAAIVGQAIFGQS
jgi:hypothetical protein